MKNSSVVFFTNDKDKHLRLIDMLNANTELFVCSYNAESWTDIDFYSSKNAAFVFDEIPRTKEALWIISKLSEDGLFASVPVLFTTFEAMYEFENSGFGSFAYDVLPQPFDYELAFRRFQNLSEIKQLKNQIFNLTQIHTKRILNQANKLKEQNARMQSINYDLVELLVAAIESRDLESGQHIKRIRYFTKALTDSVMNLCPEYGITKEQAEYIFYASSVHDIGKIAIPDAIMLKPGRLTPDEFEIMKTHTTRGFALLNMLDDISEQNEYFKYCQEICHYHHERWDGRGYPEGLVGDDTPISAQIVAVCDCYDALTSNRPYKNALSHQDAVDLIMSGGCGAFSTKLLKCFSSCINEFARIEKEFKSAPVITETGMKPVELPKKQESVSSFTEAEENILAANDILFHANIKDGYFNVLRGNWTWLFPYVPKNFTEVISQCLKICHPADAARFATKVNIDAFTELAKTGKYKTRIEFRVIKDGKEYLAVGFIVFQTDDDKNLIGLNGIFNVFDSEEIVTDIKQGLGVTDSLTGLLLQKQFEADVNSYIKDNITANNLLIHIDIDDMSLCNNLFGYEYGNVLIKDFASKLRGITGTDKILCKAASDKFLLFVKDIKSQAETVMFIDNLHNLLQKPYQTGKESGKFTASMGIARYPNDGKDFKSLAVAAEFATKSTKSNGGNSYSFFNTSMQNLANFSLDKESVTSQSDSDYIAKFIPLIHAETGELLSYDYLPFTMGDSGEVPISVDAYYEINKNTKSNKSLSVLSLKTLLYSMISLRDSGKKVPPVSIYAMIDYEDVSSYISELKTFITENNCKNIDLTILMPQDILDKMSISRIKNLSDVIHKFGFKLGIFRIGTRYIHNYCHMRDLFDRYVVKSEYINHTVTSNGNIKYCADTLSILRKFVDSLVVPSAVPDYEKELIAKGGYSDFYVYDNYVKGVNGLLSDFNNRKVISTKPSSKKKNVITELDPTVAYTDVIKSGMIWVFYDIKNHRVSFSSNASDVLGFDIFATDYEFDPENVLKYIHPDDVHIARTKITQSEMNLDVNFFEARIATGPNRDVYKNFRVTIICAVDENGAPARFQCVVSENSK